MDTPGTPSSAAEAPGERIGKYAVDRKLGEGATSEVYLCTDPFNDREVAVKLLKPDVVDSAEPGRVDEWLHEARAVSRLTHPNIVPVYAVQADAHGLPQVVMRRIAGRTWPAAERRVTVLELHE